MNKRNIPCSIRKAVENVQTETASKDNTPRDEMLLNPMGQINVDFENNKMMEMPAHGMTSSNDFTAELTKN